MEEYSGFLERLEEIFSEGRLNLTLMASAIGALLIFVNLGVNFINSYIKSDGLNGAPKFFDIPELKRSIASYMMIFIIPAILVSIKTIGVKLTNTLGFDIADLMEVWGALVNKNIDENWYDKYTVFAISSGAFKLCSFLLIFIRTAVTVFVYVTLTFAITVSPLAAAFSILGFLKEQMLQLLKIAMNLAFVGLTLGIIDLIMIQILSAITELQGLNALQYTMLAGSTLFVMVVFYIMSVWLTSLYVGSPAAGVVMSTASTVAAVTAGLAIQAASMGAGLVGAGAGGAVNSGDGGGISDVIDKAKGDLDQN